MRIPPVSLPTTAIHTTLLSRLRLGLNLMMIPAQAPQVLGGIIVNRTAPLMIHLTGSRTAYADHTERIGHRPLAHMPVTFENPLTDTRPITVESLPTPRRPPHTITTKGNRVRRCPPRTTHGNKYRGIIAPLAPPAGLEPASSGFGDRPACQLAQSDKQSTGPESNRHHQLGRLRRYPYATSAIDHLYRAVESAEKQTADRSPTQVP